MPPRLIRFAPVFMRLPEKGFVIPQVGQLPGQDPRPPHPPAPRPAQGRSVRGGTSVAGASLTVSASAKLRFGPTQGDCTQSVAAHAGPFGGAHMTPGAHALPESSWLGMTVAECTNHSLLRPCFLLCTLVEICIFKVFLKFILGQREQGWGRDRGRENRENPKWAPR